MHLTDLVLRRTSIAFTGTLSTALLDELADLAGDELGWDDARRGEEIAATRALLAERHGVHLQESASAV